MSFKNIKGFGLGGKPKDKNQEKPDVSSNDSSKVVEMKNKLSSRTKGLEETEKKLNGLIADNGTSEASGPHGPLVELSLEPGQLETEQETDDEEISVEPKESVIKVVEMSKIPEANTPVVTEIKSGTAGIKDIKTSDAPAPAAPADKPEGKPESEEDSLSNLFSTHDEEVNPLANLISSLPDVTIQELVDDLSEIRGIIKEWQKG
jgi:hypothetical protein